MCVCVCVCVYVCSTIRVFSIMMPVGDVQYREVFSTVEDIIIIVGYLMDHGDTQYRGDIMMYVGDIYEYHGVFSTVGGYHPL